MGVNVVLYQPEIPPNTGTIARTCAATATSLHLIKPLGFSIDDKHVKRAGLDYWKLLDLHVYENVEEFFEKNKDKKIYFGTTKANAYYTDMKYEEDCFIMFGKETAGIPMDILNKYKDTCIKIPMIENEAARSLNLSNSVNIVLFEVLRQLGFKDLV